MLGPSQLGKIIATTHAQDQSYSIPYRPQYTRITGKVAASILLQQISYWWHIKGGKPFYKFRAPCGHNWYKGGDSWTEELGMTTGGFDTALKAIGAKVTKGKSKSALLKTNLVIYWTDADRVTWYQLNEKLFYELVFIAYDDPNLLGKSGFRNQLDKHGNVIYPYSETTPETTRHGADAPPAPTGAIAEPPLWPWECGICGKRAAINKDNIVNCPHCDASYHRDSAPNQEPPICTDCHKPTATSADMPFVGETCTCPQEAAFIEAFGPPPERPERKPPPHWHELVQDPRVLWGDHSDTFKELVRQYGESGVKVKFLGYDWEQLTQLEPDWEDKQAIKSWSSGLWVCLKAAGGDASIVLDATRKAIEDGLTISNPYSVVKVTQALCGERKRGTQQRSGMGSGIVYP